MQLSIVTLNSKFSQINIKSRITKIVVKKQASKTNVETLFTYLGIIITNKVSMLYSYRYVS